MRVAVIGATGLIGSLLLPRLKAHQLLILARRPTERPAVREKIGPIDQWVEFLRDEQLDVAVSTIGTTWRKAQNWVAFAAVDEVAVVNFAVASFKAGARQLICVSSVGADPASANPYLAMKGRMEQAVQAVGFERVDIFRPGLLRGERGADRRLAERLGIIVSPLINLFLRGRLERFAAIDADLVAAAIAKVVGRPAAGVHCHFNSQIRALANA